LDIQQFNLKLVKINNTYVLYIEYSKIKGGRVSYRPPWFQTIRIREVQVYFFRRLFTH